MGIGSTRIGIQLDDKTVAKVAWKPSGLFRNQFESHLFSYLLSIKKEALFAPVISWKAEDPLMQALCFPVKFEATDDFKNLISDLAKIGVTDAAVNVGLFQNRLVCFDYSSPSVDLFFKVESYIKRKTGDSKTD